MTNTVNKLPLPPDSAFKELRDSHACKANSAYGRGRTPILHLTLVNVMEEIPCPSLTLAA